MLKVIVVTTRSKGREHFNVLYSDVLLVESETLQFDEPEFDVNNYTLDEVSDRLRDLGYRVTEPDTAIMVAGRGI